MQLVKPFRVIFILLCLITVSAFGEARSLDDIKDSGLIRIAVYTDYPPFSFIENDNPTGIDIDIAREIASALGVELELIWMTQVKRQRTISEITYGRAILSTELRLM